MDEIGYDSMSVQGWEQMGTVALIQADEDRIKSSGLVDVGAAKLEELIVVEKSSNYLVAVKVRVGLAK